MKSVEINLNCDIKLADFQKPPQCSLEYMKIGGPQISACAGAAMAGSNDVVVGGNETVAP